MGDFSKKKILQNDFERKKILERKYLTKTNSYIKKKIFHGA